MFGKNPYMLPGIALVFLIVLFVYQTKQRALSETYVKKTVESSLTIEESDFKNSSAKAINCEGSDVSYLSYYIGKRFSKGSIEFDILKLGKGNIIVAFADDLNLPCEFSEKSSNAIFGLFLDKDGKKFSLGNVLIDIPKRFPVRILLEWDSGNVSLFMSGQKCATFDYNMHTNIGSYSMIIGHDVSGLGMQLGNLKFEMFN